MSVATQPPQEEVSEPAFISMEEDRLRRTGLAVLTALVAHAAFFLVVAILDWGAKVPPPPEETVVVLKEPARIDDEPEVVKVDPPKDAVPDLESLIVPDEDRRSDEGGVKAVNPDAEIGDRIETADGAEGHGAKGDPDSTGRNLAAAIDNFGAASGIRAVHGAGSGHGTEERYGQRGPGGQRNMTVKYGGNRSTQEAVKMSLEWLRKHQSADGRWDADGFDQQCTAGRCGGKGEECWDVGVTGLALEAFLGHGDTHRSDGPYRETVDKAIRYLLSVQQAGGHFGEEKKAASQQPLMYNQCLATYALSEAYGMTKDPKLREPVERAVKYLLDAQNPGMGWRYANYRKHPMEEEYGFNDTSVTGWAVMALHAAEDAGIQVPKSAYDGANAWLDEVQQTKGYKVTYGYNAPGKWVPGDGRYVATAAGALIRQFTGVDRGVDGAIPVLLDRLPEHKKLNSYLWYYATLVTFQYGGEPWRKWNEKLKKEICGNLHKDDADKCVWGSMDPDSIPWGGQAGGRVYSTACAALCMEVYYRYKRVKPERVGKPVPEEKGAPPPADDEPEEDGKE